MSNPSEKLLIAAANGNLENVIQELKNNANINATDLNGYSPIHCAVYNNKVEVVKYLVKMGANVLMKDTHAYVGFTPLHYASAFGSIDMVKALLLSTEQNIHCKNSTGQTPADVASNSEVKQLLLLDEQLRKSVVEQPKLEKVEFKNEGVSQEQQPNLEENNCCRGSGCKGKIVKKVLLGLVALIFFGVPAIQMFVDVDAFPYYIFPNALIIWVAGLFKIARKCRSDEKLKEKKGLMVHGWTVLVLNVLVILINLMTSNAPWWIIVALITGAPVLIHKIVKKGCCGRKEFKGIAIHAVVYASFLVGSYVLYCLTQRYKSFFGLLFWFFPSALWTVGFVFHVYLTKKQIRIVVQNSTDVENPKKEDVVQENVSFIQNNVVEQSKSEQSTIYPQVL